MNRALSIGCSAYDDPDIASLRFAGADAARIGDTLRDVCGVPPEALTVLRDGTGDPGTAPTRTNILRQLTRLRDQARASDDVLFFFFSGHGFQSPDGRQYLLPADCVRGAIEETALAFDLVVSYLGSAESRHVILFLDACRNIVTAGKSAGDELPRANVAQLCPPGVVTFCSCEPGRVSYEVEALGSGVFSAALVEALSETGRCRTVYELDAYLIRRVPEIGSGHGKPPQLPYSRVEPLGIQHLEIVSAGRSARWRSITELGEERRNRRVPRDYSLAVPADPVIAVDFGTSYSVVSWARGDADVVLLPGTDGRFLVPSVVHFLPGFDYLIGSQAVEVDRYRPAGTIRHMKRALGTGVTFDIDGRSIAPELAASLVIRSLKRNAEEALGVPVRRCVASHPANFSLSQTAALRRAYDLAGLDVLRMSGEPNLAALNVVGPDRAGSSVITLVVDLGGGTFDVAVVDSGEGVVEVRACAGSNEVGGLDFDAAVAEYAADQLVRVHGVSADAVRPVMDEVRREAERAKRDLGRNESTTILLVDVADGDRGVRDIAVPLDRATFREITTPLNARIRDTITEVLPVWRDMLTYFTAAGDTTAVFLAGQGSKIFTVAETLRELDFDAPIINGYQETAVARGAGLMSGVLVGSVKNQLLLDVLRHGIAVRRRPGGGGTADRPNLDTISRDPADNTALLELVAPNTTIPTLRSVVVGIEGAGNDVTLEFVGVPESLGERLGQITHRTRSERLELRVDVDANALVVFEVIDEGTPTRWPLTGLSATLDRAT